MRIRLCVVKEPNAKRLRWAEMSRVAAGNEAGIHPFLPLAREFVKRRSLFLPLLLAILGVASVESMAETASWKLVSAPSGGPVRSLVQQPSNPDVVFALGQVGKGGIWKSADRGMNWALWSMRDEDSSVRDFAVDPQDPRIAFKATGMGLYRTRDEGVSWQWITPLSSFFAVHFVALHPMASGLVYAYIRADFGSGVWRSEDGGDSWTPPGEGLGNVTALAIAPDDPHTLFVGTQQGRVLKSADAGVNWTPVALEQSRLVRGLAIDQSDPSVVYAAYPDSLFRSTDRGETWAEIGFDDGAFTGVTVSSDGAVYALTNEELYRSVDRGAGWTSLGLQQGLTDLLADFDERQLLLAATSSGVFRRELTDPWSASNDGLENGLLFSLIPHPASPEILFAGGDGAVFRRDEGAQTWSRFALPIDPDSPSSGNVSQIVIDPHDHDTIYAGTFQGVFRSRNGGVHWEAVNSGLDNLHVRALAADPNRPGRLYAAMGQELFAGSWFAGHAGGVFRSDDGGDNWVAGALQGSFIRCLAVDPLNDLVLTNRRRSEDGGMTFVEFDNVQHPWPHGGCRSLQFHPTRPDVLYLTNVGGVFRSEDGGFTWTALNKGFGAPDHFFIHLAFSRDDPEIMYLASDQGIYQTRTGGLLWIPITGGFPGRLAECVAVDPRNPLNAFSCPRMGGLAHYASILPGPEELRFPAYSAFLFGGGEFTGVALTNLGTKAAEVQLTALGPRGDMSPEGAEGNPAFIQLAPGQRRAFLAREVFGQEGDDGEARWLRVDSSSPDVVSLQSVGRFDLSALTASALDSLGLSEFALTEIVAQGSTSIQLANPNPQEVQAAVTLFSADGNPKGDSAVFEIPPFGVVRKELEEIADGADVEDSDFLIGGSAQRVISMALIRPQSGDFSVVPFLDRRAGATELLAPHYAAADSFVTEFSLINLDDFCEIPASVHLRLFRDDGVRMGASHVLIPCGRSVVIRDPELFGSSNGKGFSGYVAIESSRPIGGAVRHRGEGAFRFLGVSPLVSSFSNEFIVNHLVSSDGDFMGLAIVNPSEQEAEVRMEAFGPSGESIAASVQVLPPGHRASRLLTEHLPELSGTRLLGGYVRISSEVGIAVSAIYAPSRLTSLMPVPAQPLSDP